jgi:hypothetical protein
VHAQGLQAAPYRIYEKNHTKDTEHHRYQMAQHIVQLRKILAILRSIHNSIREFPQLLAQCTQALRNFMGTDLHFVLNALTAASRNITHAELAQIPILMVRPFLGGAIETFHDQFSKLAAFYLHVTGEAMAEHEQLRLYIEALSNGPFRSTFEHVVRRFDRDRPRSFGAVAAGHERTLAALQASTEISFNSMSFADKEQLAAAHSATLAIQGDTLADIEDKARHIRHERRKKEGDREQSDGVMSYKGPSTPTPERQRRQTTKQEIEKLVAQAVAKQSTLPSPKKSALKSSTTSAARQRDNRPRSRSSSPTSDTATYDCVYHGTNPSHPTSKCKVIINMTDAQRDDLYRKYYTKAK